MGQHHAEGWEEPGFWGMLFCFSSTYSTAGVHQLLIGFLIAFPWLKAQGYQVHTSAFYFWMT